MTVKLIVQRGNKYSEESFVLFNDVNDELILSKEEALGLYLNLDKIFNKNKNKKKENDKEIELK